MLIFIWYVYIFMIKNRNEHSFTNCWIYNCQGGKSLRRVSKPRSGLFALLLGTSIVPSLCHLSHTISSLGIKSKSLPPPLDFGEKLFGHGSSRGLPNGPLLYCGHSEFVLLRPTQTLKSTGEKQDGSRGVVKGGGSPLGWVGGGRHFKW